MTPMQHRAVLVCILCVLAVLLTFGITTTLLKKGGEESDPSVSESVADPTPGEDLSGHYQIDNASTALLTETADAGTDYLNDTLFLGDSNTVRLYNNGLISLQQFCAKEGIGTQVALNEGIVTFKKDSNHYTIPQAVAMMKPRRVVMTFGTNDTGMEVADFIAHYTALIQAIQQSYPYADIIVNTVPPVPADHSNYPHMDQAKIDDFNMALLDLCEQLGVRFLNSAEALKGSDGYGIADYYTSGDIHLKSAGLKAVLNYLRTHALQTEDRRPDTNNIPTRTMEYVSNPSSAVAAPSSEAVSSSESQAESASSSESSSSESTGEGKKFEARYRVDKNGGGTLSVGNDTGNSSVTYTVTDPDKSITVTAVPAEGHVFVKWSDGLTSKTRTDTDFKQNLDVTAVFGTASVHITSEGKGAVGSSYTFKAALSGKYAKTENLRWYANGQEVTQAAGKSSITVVVDNSMVNASYKIHAVVTYNDCKVSSNTLTITIGSGVTSESGSTSSSSSSHAGSSGSTSSSSSSASSGSSSHSTSSSSSGSSKAEPESESKAESKAESKTESKAESKVESKAESKAESKVESKAESKAESKSESKAESKAESKSEASASKEAESKAE
ncbi:SGNH/GDSL hydrolase family protein [Faecalibacterium sp. Marseille-P9590]|uniref:SGNH/GDSL hydrolase family protein n=1 Tax=Faecalibacterium sp. Marseille-P9590 TaxID=2817017 RepID=UPI001A9C1646|nr:SGNH/GDSL hydrolase family protein [Faecalibacterium sp. Marseille-P9590]MBO1291170.1 lipase [Faecalibacterium sp. Marseille-P9590]